jgi:hypothetical protein
MQTVKDGGRSQTFTKSKTLASPLALHQFEIFAFYFGGDLMS